MPCFLIHCVWHQETTWHELLKDPSVSVKTLSLPEHMQAGSGCKNIDLEGERTLNSQKIDCEHLTLTCHPTAESKLQAHSIKTHGPHHHR